jgi:hypothetical protein
VLDGRDLTDREKAFWRIVHSSNSYDEARRKEMALDAAKTLTPDEFHLASLVVSLFQFYNSFVDLNGVAELTAEGYRATGERLATQGYAPVTPTTSN